MRKWIISVVIVVIVVTGGGLIYTFFARSLQTEARAESTKAETPKFASACKFTSSAAVATAFGVPFYPGTLEPGGLGSGGATIEACRYKQVVDDNSEALLGALNFSVKISTYKTTVIAKRALTTIKGTAKVGGATYFAQTNVPEVGDEAFFFNGQAPATLKTEEAMYIRTGNQIINLVAIQINGIDHAKAQQAMVQIAKATD